MMSIFDRVPDEVLELILQFVQPPPLLCVTETVSHEVLIRRNFSKVRFPIHPSDSDSPELFGSRTTLPEHTLVAVNRRFRRLSMSLRGGWAAFDPEIISWHLDSKVTTSQTVWGKRQWNAFASRHARLFKALCEDPGRMSRVSHLSGRILSMKNTRFELINELLGKIRRDNLVSLALTDCRDNVQAHVLRWVLGLPVPGLVNGDEASNWNVGGTETFKKLKHVAVNGLVSSHADLAPRLGLLLSKYAPRLSSFTLEGSYYVAGKKPDQILRSMVEFGGFVSSLHRLTITEVNGLDLSIVANAAPSVTTLFLSGVVCTAGLSELANLTELSLINTVLVENTDPCSILTTLSDLFLSRLVSFSFVADSDFDEMLLKSLTKCSSLRALELGIDRIKVGHLAWVLRAVGCDIRTLRVGRILDIAMNHYKRQIGLKIVNYGPCLDRVYEPVDLSKNWELRREGITDAGQVEWHGDIEYEEHPMFWASFDEVHGKSGSHNLQLWKNRCISMLHRYCPNLEWANFRTEGTNGRGCDVLTLERSHFGFMQIV
ncbi:hypothetical protein BDR26DRAFT_850367 [Obelidium mucronatum]|nr:hypothetical protein BDR26DRAFT_850367 [Obelidium mucronatum]